MTIHLPKVNGFGGGNGGGGASFPIIVTDSGSSLPVDLSGYQAGDTFLNTSDKKIYKASVDSYELNTNVTNTATFDSSTGIVSGFYANNWQDLGNVFKRFTWTGDLTFQVKFKFTSANSGDRCIIDFNIDYNAPGNGVAFFLTNGKLHYVRYTDSNTDYTKNTDLELIDYTLEVNKEYVLVIRKTGTSCIVDLQFDNTIISSNSFEVPSILNGINNYVCLGTKKAKVYVPFTNGYIYLGETSGDFVTASLSWDSGTSLTDKTEYADKTNGALYLYENTELVKIGSSAPTVLTDQTATSMALAGNTIYKWTSALTELSFASVEVSDLETRLYFTTGNSISFTDSSSLKWGGDGTAPSLETNTRYCIAICNGLAEINTFGTTA